MTAHWNPLESADAESLTQKGIDHALMAYPGKRVIVVEGWHLYEPTLSASDSLQLTYLGHKPGVVWSEHILFDTAGELQPGGKLVSSWIRSMYAGMLYREVGPIEVTCLFETKETVLVAMNGGEDATDKCPPWLGSDEKLGTYELHKNWLTIRG
ncbi:hypothetical protein HNP46_000444 [Pseudomonas nitritireducens]|uniref:DUF6957 domain-containing protein n=1 Tax=Pseudomonas nitroreducens TaxID=46680 RepID=A0A7W7KGF5_PSENT|nr:hypothetical protein [Pseudomonas nitritireducens]MBB4861633.1 hypothetical protein [Pseudomonas nitritireducens]